MLPRALLPAVAAACLLAPAAADAKPVAFKVAKATHASSAAKTTADYAGRSTVTWSLAKGRSVLRLDRAGGQVTGFGTVRVRGAYAIDAATSQGRCAWTAATGDQEHPHLAPEPFELLVAPDPSAPGRWRVSHTAQQATLGNAWLGTACTTSIDAEPTAAETSSLSVAPAAFRRRAVVLVFRGATDREGLAYRWETKLLLKRR